MLLMYSIYWCSQLCYVNCWPTTCELMTWWCCIVRHHHVLLTYLTYGCRDALFAFISVFVTVTLLLLGDISYKWFRRMRSMLPFHGLFVCLSSSRIVLKRRKISTQFLFHTKSPCLSQTALKFGLHRLTPSSPNFAPDWPTPADLSVVNIPWQIAAEWFKSAFGHNGEPTGICHHSFQWYDRTW